MKWGSPKKKTYSLQMSACFLNLGQILLILGLFSYMAKSHRLLFCLVIARSILCAGTMKKENQQWIFAVFVPLRNCSIQLPSHQCLASVLSAAFASRCSTSAPTVLVQLRRAVCAWQCLYSLT